VTGRRIRIAILLAVLAMVGLDAWLTRARTTSWDKTLRVTVFPIVADGRPATRDYVASLRREAFAPIEDFVRREAERYGIANPLPLGVRLGPVLDEPPPLPPADRGLLGTVSWSLRLRWWAGRREAALPRPRSQVRMFVLYYDPAGRDTVPHSLGLKEGLIGIVHGFAARHMTETNNVVIAHELLHTVGATDKYDPATGQPRFPDGYAEPDRSPRHPQAAAELMGGRIVLSPTTAEVPHDLDQVRVGPATAREVGWLKKGSDPFSAVRP
jgi:hypothetical protein